jgi:pyruvate/2-oxoglutarate dehydrogenase complex dihydrolipoamide acyltransferase (E2) component
MVEKTTYEITAPAAGRLHILVPKDGVVQPGTVIGRVDET